MKGSLLGSLLLHVLLLVVAFLCIQQTPEWRDLSGISATLFHANSDHATRLPRRTMRSSLLPRTSTLGDVWHDKQTSRPPDTALSLTHETAVFQPLPTDSPVLAAGFTEGTNPGELRARTEFVDMKPTRYSPAFGQRSKSSQQTFRVSTLASSALEVLDRTREPKRVVYCLGVFWGAPHDRLRATAEVAKAGLSQLTPEDQFVVMFFGVGGIMGVHLYNPRPSRPLEEMVWASRENVQIAQRLLDESIRPLMNLDRYVRTYSFIALGRDFLTRMEQAFRYGPTHVVLVSGDWPGPDEIILSVETSWSDMAQRARAMNTSHTYLSAVGIDVPTGSEPAQLLLGFADQGACEFVSDLRPNMGDNTRRRRESPVLVPWER